MSISNKNGPASAFRATRPRPARRTGVESSVRTDPAANFASAPDLASLIARAWAAPEAEPQGLASIIEQAVGRAREDRDVRARFWAHLARALLRHEERSWADGQADFEEAAALAPLVGDERGHRLLAVCEATLMMRAGRHEAARERFARLPLQGARGIQDADDHFIHHGLATCASKLGDIETMFRALCANQRLAAALRSPIRAARAGLSLAAALLAADEPLEADLLLAEHARPDSPARQVPGLWAELGLLRCLADECGGHSRRSCDELGAIVRSGVTDRMSRLRFPVRDALLGSCIARGRWDDARRQLPGVYEAAHATGRAIDLGASHHHAARVARRDGQVEQSCSLLERALDIFEADPALAARASVHGSAALLLAETHAEQGRFDKAYDAQRRYVAMYKDRMDFVARCRAALASARRDTGVQVALTERERDCLAWCAAGKTAWETGQILKLSEWTVVYHLEKAKRKFGLTRKQQVVARAIALGLIKDGSPANAVR